MISPSDHIQELINEQYRTLDATHSRLSGIWLKDILFTFGWMTTLLLTVVPWIVWFIFRDKESSTRLMLGGLWSMLISSWLDYVGVTLGLWRYYNKLIPLIPDYLAWDFALMPVTIMFFLQIKPQISPLMKGVLFAGLTAFIAEPIFLWLGYFKYPGWNSVFSFPFFFIIYLIAHKLVHSSSHKPLL
ncbi:CBO0543 family protein [Neobacillus muris]|uniref:CBO0543 family protein n=1 Tax=Neobacillus muris TaxID=2941334 RepID=UPI00203F3A00|nr:CBO0543 family protein [Neobacillus muris]